MSYLTVVLVFAASFTLGVPQRPDYIKLCDFNKPNANECALESANYAIPYIVKGDKKFNIPSLNPLHVPLIEVEQSGFKLTLTDVEVFGLQDIKVTDLKMDPRNFDAVLHIDTLNIIGKYNVDGKVLVLNLKGEGPANVTAVGGDYHVKAIFTPYQKNDKTYLKFDKPTIDIELKRAYFSFDNLLSGDDRLGPEINKILNENWENLLSDLGAPIKQAVVVIVESIVSNILDKVPESELTL